MARRPDTKVVIFDFDGTLGDVVPLMREIYGQFAQKRGFPELTEKDFQELRKKNLREVLKWMGIKPWQIPGLLKEGRALYYTSRKKVTLFPGIAELLRQLHDDGWEMYILSSNSPRTIKEIMHRHKLEKFIHILKRPPLFGKSSSIKGLIRTRGYDRSNVWMVGDEVRDIEAANKARVDSIAVAWGLQHEVALTKAKPTHIALKVSQLQSFLESGK